MSEDIFELKIVIGKKCISADAVIEAMLVNLGIPLTEILKTEDSKNLIVCLYSKSVDKLEKVKKIIKTSSIKNIRIQIRKINKNWKDKWKMDFKPFTITDNIRIIPAWLRKGKRFSSENEVIIDTTFAFGTGLHPTTKLTADLISLRKNEFKTFLDIGVGSGILSLIANVYNAENITAIDIENDSIKTAENNFLINKCRNYALKKQSLSQLSTKKKYDFVACNLFALDLIKNRNKLQGITKKGKYLAISGITRDNYKTFKNAFKVKKMKLIKTLYLKDWMAQLYQKK